MNRQSFSRAAIAGFAGVVFALLVLVAGLVVGSSVRPLTDDPNGDEQLHIARRLYNTREYQQSFEQFDAWIQKSTDTVQRPRALYESGFALYRMERWSDAISRFKQVKKEFPDSIYAVDALLQAGHIEFGLGQYSDAERTYETLVASDDTTGAREGRFQLIQVAYNQGNPRKTLSRFKEFRERYAKDIRNREMCDTLLRMDRVQGGMPLPEKDQKELAKACARLPEPTEGTELRIQ